MEDFDRHQASDSRSGTVEGAHSDLASTKNRFRMSDEAGAQDAASPQALEYDYTNFYFGAGDDPFALLEPFDEWYTQVRPAGYYQYEIPLLSAPATTVDVRDTLTGEVRTGLVNFASYNYLGLSYRPEVKQAIKDAVDVYGGGASGSPILSGTTDLHVRLTEAVARFKRKEGALIFPTGYSANVGSIAGLMRSGDLIVADQWAHASIVDGMILSKAKSRFFRHNKPEDLDRKLAGVEGKKLVIVEGVYSMDGDVVCLPDIVEVCRKHAARLMIDEAHSAFVYGENGRGVVEQFGLEDEVDIHLGTFSKSLGGQGGYIAGSTKLINYIRGFSRSRFFSCALAPTVVAGLLEALRIAENEPHLRVRLWDNVRYMQNLLREGGVDIGESTSQVIPIMIRNDTKILGIGEQFLREGVFINPVKYPAVPKHKSRFRMSISAAHSINEMERGADIIIEVLRKNGVIA
jgi:8-amino-7-oxononanoate synthase